MGTGLAIILSTLIAGIVTAVGAIASKQSVSNTNQANKDLAGMQNQWNVEQWNRQNAYNTPVQQLQRLNDANLNPALAMTSGNMVESSTADKLESAQPHPMQPYDFSSSMNNLSGNIQDAGIRQAQVDLANSQAEKNNAEAEAIKTKLPEEVKQISAQTDELKQGVQNMQKQLDVMTAQIRNLDNDSAKKFVETLHIPYLEDLYNKNYKLDIDKYNTQVDLVKSEIKKNYSQSYLNFMSGNLLKTQNQLTAVDLAYATKTLNYRILQTQQHAFLARNQFLLSDLELKRGKMVLDQLGFEIQTMKYNNPWLDWMNAVRLQKGENSFAYKLLNNMVMGGKLGQSLMSGILDPFKGIFGSYVGHTYSNSTSSVFSTSHVTTTTK